MMNIKSLFIAKLCKVGQALTMLFSSCPEIILKIDSYRWMIKTLSVEE